MTNHSPVGSQSGYLLVEFAVGVSILTIGILAFMNSYATNYRAFNTVVELDEVHVAFETVAESLVNESLQDVYNNFDGVDVQVPNLPGPDGNPARVEIDCFIDEDQIPAEFGVILDIYGNPAQNVAGPLVALKILPVRLRVTYAALNGPETHTLYVVLGSD